MSDKLMDWAGESVDRDSCPPCTKHPDCFACVEGYCTTLRIPDGRVSKKKKSANSECSFYKPIQQVKESGARCYQRLKELGRRDLIDKYADTLIVTGAMDDEIQEANLQAEEFDQFREVNFNEQMEKVTAEETTLAAEDAPTGA